MPGARGRLTVRWPAPRLDARERPSYSTPCALTLTLILGPGPFSYYACLTTGFSIILATVSFIDNHPSDIAYTT